MKGSIMSHALILLLTATTFSAIGFFAGFCVSAIAVLEKEKTEQKSYEEQVAEALRLANSFKNN